MSTAKTYQLGLLKWLAIAVLGFASLCANAEPKAGKGYQVVNPPVPVETGKKIEVVELFWYGCPHCYDLEPEINAWAKKLPADVAYRHQPAVFREEWVPGVKTYHSLESLGLVKKLHGEVFNAIHKQNFQLNDEKVLLDWIAKQGVDRKKFADAYNSFSMQGKVARAKQLTRAYGITGVPAVVVDGKYVTNVTMAGGKQQLFDVLDQLIKMARQERGAKR